MNHMFISLYYHLPRCIDIDCLVLHFFTSCIRTGCLTVPLKRITTHAVLATFFFFNQWLIPPHSMWRICIGCLVLNFFNSCVLTGCLTVPSPLSLPKRIQPIPPSTRSMWMGKSSPLLLLCHFKLTTLQSLLNWMNFILFMASFSHLSNPLKFNMHFPKTQLTVFILSVVYIVESSLVYYCGIYCFFSASYVYW